MASQAEVANGFKLQRGDNADPVVFHDVAEVFNVALAAATAPDIDVSHSQSTGREKRAGMPDFGTVTVTMNLVWGNTEQEAMEDEAGSNVVREYRVVLPGGTRAYRQTWILKAISPGGFEVDGKLIRTASFAASGAPTRETITP